ncbi:MAG: hypothetical protein WAX80_02335 [Minisyncoccia bacterium]
MMQNVFGMIKPMRQSADLHWIAVHRRLQFLEVKIAFGNHLLDVGDRGR